MALVPGINFPEEWVLVDPQPFWRYLLPPPAIDAAALEVVWSELDRRLADEPLVVRKMAPYGAALKIVELFGIIAVHVEPERGDVACYAIHADGSRHRMGHGWPLDDALSKPFWLRFAFQRWAPHLSRVDFFSDPLNRPATLELDTGRFLMRRLRADARYSRLCDAFVAALDIPAHVIDAIHREHRSATAETLSEYYWPMNLPSDS